MLYLNNIIHGIIIILFTINLAINLKELLEFYNSKFIAINSPFKSDAPRYENLYRAYCENNFQIINNLKLKPTIIIGFTIFSLLLIIFYGGMSIFNIEIINKIMGVKQLNGEIKLLFYKKHFNKLSSTNEYNIINSLRIYIGILFIYYLASIISTYTEYNKTEKLKNNYTNNIDEIVKNNIKCELYNYLIYKEDYEQNTEILSKYIKRNENSINELTHEQKIIEIVKIIFTYEISTGSSFHHKNRELSLRNKNNKDNNDICAEVSDCFFSSLSNIKNNEIFSDYDILESRDIISELINYDQYIMEELQIKYLSIRDIIHSASAKITRRKDYDMIGYKFSLAVISLLAIYFSLSAIYFFVFFELTIVNMFWFKFPMTVDTYYSIPRSRYIDNFIYVVFASLFLSIIIL